MSTVIKKPRIADAELSLLIRAREKRGAEILYDTYADFLLLAISRIVPERQLAEQVFQACFQKIWYSIDDYVIEKERIYSWMIAIARKTAFETLAETKKNDEDKSEGVYARKE